MLAIAAQAIERQLMSLHSEALRCELLHVSGACMYIEYQAAVVAVEVVVVLVVSEFVAGWLARQLDDLYISRVQQLLDVAIDGGQAEGRNFALGMCKDFCRQ